MNSTIKTFCLLYSIERSKAIKVRDDWGGPDNQVPDYQNEGPTAEQVTNDFVANN